MHIHIDDEEQQKEATSKYDAVFPSKMGKGNVCLLRYAEQSYEHDTLAMKVE